ncbi:MAG: cell division protein FtsZ [Chloroflexi bacterium]|nr:cell division protein FtsZ [Chloroflexota bacterium]
MVVGCGQCGGRIAEQFARINMRAHFERGIEIATGVFAVNTDIADLSGLSAIKPDYNHRILIGGQKTGGHGVGKINELGAEIAREDADKIISAITQTPRFQETDAFLIAASAAGGTGSGSISVVTKYIKERYVDKPAYNLIILPFSYEETTEERTIYNVATCLKSSYLIADAVFLVDNQRYVRKQESIDKNLSKINELIVEPFYNILCAGEEKKAKYIGSRVMDAGDIIQSLSGWTVIGHSKMRFSKFPFLFDGRSDFRNTAALTQRGTQAMNQAISDLSLKCNPADAQRALYLLSAPHKEINMDIINEVSGAIRRLAPNAIIRSGDYPRESNALDVAIILSEILNVKKVSDYFTKAISYISSIKRRWEGTEFGDKSIENAIFDDIPSLL